MQLMPLFIYQNMLNLTGSISIRMCANKFKNVVTWEQCSFECEIIGCLQILQLQLRYYSKFCVKSNSKLLI
jgi:hypothetical protein